MDSFQAHNKQKQKQSPKHSPSRRLTQDQVRLLERSFVANKKLNTERKLQLADELGLPPRQVAVWYQNRRARWKTQALELDHSTLQLKLDSALADKKKLEEDVEVLKGELKRARDLIFSLGGVRNDPPSSSPTNFSVVSSFDCMASGGDADEGGSRSCALSKDVNGCWDDDDSTRDDLYACWILTNGSNMD